MSGEPKTGEGAIVMLKNSAYCYIGSKVAALGPQAVWPSIGSNYQLMLSEKVPISREVDYPTAALMTVPSR